MKKLLLTTHLVAGLAAALFLIVISLSGAVIAFEGELNHIFHRDLTEVANTGHPLDWDVFRAQVEQQSPGWKLIRIYFPDRPDRSTYVRLRNTTTHKARHIYADQYTGKVLGSTEDGSNWIIKVHDLHVNFLAGKVGNQIVTWSSIFLLVLAVTGIWLWLPRPIFRFAVSSPPVRLNRDLHRSVGFWSFLPLLAFSLTGLALHYQTGKLLTLLNNPAASHTVPGHGTSIEGMLASGREALPGAVIPRLLLSEKAGDPVFLYLRFPEDKTPAGRSFVTLDPKTGNVLSVGSSRTASFLQTALVQYAREIHTGVRFGLASQILVAFFAVLLAVLAVSGPFIWFNKWRATARGRKHLRRVQQESVAAD